MAGNLYATNGTLVGAAVDVTILTTARFTAKQVLISNDDPNNTYTITVQGTSFPLLHEESIRLTGRLNTVTLNGTGAYRVWASDEADPQLYVDKPQGITAGSISTADLADGLLSADAAGRAKMAAGYFGLVAASYAHFVDDFWTATQFAPGAGGKFAPGCITNANIGFVADDAFTSVEVSTVGAGGKFAAGCITTTGTAAGALFAAGAFNTAGLANCIADDAFTSVEVSTVGAGGKFAAGAITTAATAAGGLFAAGALNTAGLANVIADDAFTTAEFAAGAGGKFAAGALNNAGIANLIADDGFTATEFGAGAGGKFAANSLVTAGIANLFADDAWTSVEVSTVGAGGKFAAGAITTAATAAGGLFAAGALNTAGLANVIADDAFTTAEFAAGAGGKFAAGALNNAGLVNLVADDAFTSVEVSTVGAGGKFAAGCITTTGTGAGALFAAGAFNAAGVTNCFATNSFSAVNFGTVVAAGAIDYSKMVNRSDQALGDDGVAITTANLLGSMRISASAPRTKALPDAATIIAALPTQQIGTWFQFNVANDGASTLTLTAGAGTTTYGSLAVAATGAAAGFGTWQCLVTGAATINVYRIG